MNIIHGKTALVTGAASGIGRAIALGLAREGANLFIVDKDVPGLESARREIKAIGARCETAVCDLSKPAEIESLIQFYCVSGEHLDILVNGAGIGFHGHVEDMTDDQWQTLIAVNLQAPIQLIRGFLPKMIARSEAHIVNIASLAGLVAGRKTAAYQTSKFGLVGFTMAMRAEFSSRGIGVTAICPGIVHTPMVDQLIPGKFNRLRHFRGTAWTTANVVATKSITAIRKDKGIVVITPLAKIMWWLSRLSPSFVMWLARSHRRDAA